MIGLRLWRQRRRILLATTLAGVGGVCVAGNDWQVPVATALLASALMAITVVLAPGLRWFVLKMAMVFALCSTVYAATGVRLDILAPVGVFGLMLVPSQHRWLDHYTMPWIHRALASVEIARSVDAVWQVVRPVPGAPHWDPSVAEVRLGAEPDGLMLKRRLPDGSLVDQPLQLLDVAPLRYLKIRDRSLSEAGEDGAVTVTAFRFSGDRETCRLVLIEATWRRPLWTAFSLWLDDYLADHADHMAALIEGRPDPSLRGAILRSVGAG
ncbi:MAG: hypothetical protein AAFV19_21605 [Pseudomonadota bacterium]